MNNPKISVCRDSKRIAIFDGFDIVGKFESFTDEAKAIEDAKFRIATATNKVPEIVYPRITSMRITRSS